MSMNWTDSASKRDPFSLFGEWLRDAEATEINDPTAAAVATTDSDGMPNVRMVLLKAFDERGFVFYTNLLSAKGRELQSSQKLAMCFHWKTRKRQVRLRGTTELVSTEEADEYYASRARNSRLGAWASLQSQPMKSKRKLIQRVALYAAKFGTGAIPRPDHWTGVRLVPQSFEFWQDGVFRMHDRLSFVHVDERWRTALLYP